MPASVPAASAASSSLAEPGDHASTAGTAGPRPNHAWAKLQSCSAPGASRAAFRRSWSFDQASVADRHRPSRDRAELAGFGYLPCNCARDWARLPPRKPLYGQANLLRNFTRVQKFGSRNVHWVEVSADPRSRSVFSFESMIVAGN